MHITLKPIATVHNERKDVSDDFWGSVLSTIRLSDDIPEQAFENIEEFSHLEVIYQFNKANEDDIIYSGRPRGKAEYPVMGIFAQRKKDRPNSLGLCTVELVEHKGREIKVKYLDAIDGTPVLDIKPVMKEFGTKGEIKQPDWATDLMKDYWK